jgi:hypothetical protein
METHFRRKYALGYNMPGTSSKIVRAQTMLLFLQAKTLELFLT